MSDTTALPADRRSIEPSAEQMGTVAALSATEPVVMLNLLRFRDEADYSDAPDLAPDTPISGEAAYQRYGEAAAPHLQASGAEIVFMGPCHDTVIGPVGEEWDVVVLVKYPNPTAFLEMVMSEEYQALSRHRVAGLLDSRLVPTSQPAT